MAHQLSHEVLYHLPAGITSGERTVLLAIAYHAQHEGRRCWRSTEEMQTNTGLSERGLRKACERLADRGLECRVAQSIDKAGNPVFAHRGRTNIYHLPELPVPDDCVCRAGAGPADGQVGGTAASVTAEGGTTVPPSERNGGTRVPAYARNGGTPVPANDMNAGTTVPPSERKGGTVVPERRHHSAAQYERTKELPGGTTDVTTGTRAPTNHRPPTPHGRPDDEPRTDTPAPPEQIPPESACRQRDCRAPAACGACGRVRRAEQAAADAAQALAEQADRAAQAATAREESLRRRRATELSAATCPHACGDGHREDPDLGRVHCDHRPAYREMRGRRDVQRVLDLAAAERTTRRPPRTVDPIVAAALLRARGPAGRHRLDESEEAAS